MQQQQEEQQQRETKPTGLALLRVKFEPNQISKLPKPTRKQTDDVKNNYQNGIRCLLCGAWHHPQVVHLDYVGHAALTDRLLDVDPKWTWEPLATDDKGLPVIDKDGGLWIKLTVLGVTRLGYGDAPEKSGGNATKERIGDALRNAAMRFGAALDLWHKGELHAVEEALDKDDEQKPYIERMPPADVNKHIIKINGSKNIAELSKVFKAAYKEAAKVKDAAAIDKFTEAKDKVKAEIEKVEAKQ